MSKFVIPAIAGDLLFLVFLSKDQIILYWSDHYRKRIFDHLLQKINCLIVVKCCDSAYQRDTFFQRET